MISGTLSDLAEHRAALYGALQRYEAYDGKPPELFLWEHIAVGEWPLPADWMEVFDSGDWFLLILGWRYGYVPEVQEKSVTELEYDRAKELGMTVVPYFAAEDHPVLARDVERGENSHKLERFKAHIRRSQVVRTFGSPHDLVTKVLQDLDSLKRPFGETRQDFIDMPELGRQLASLQDERQRHLHVIEELRHRLEAIVPANPIWKSRNFKLDSALCFCLLPLQDEFIRVFEGAVMPAAEASGLRALHAGQIFDNREVIEDIWDSITTCRVVVADVTGRNPNVFYELGICHTLGKEVIVITQNAIDVPFDIRHRRFLAYDHERLASLKHSLQLTLQRVLVRSSGTNDQPGAYLTDRADGRDRRSSE